MSNVSCGGVNSISPSTVIQSLAAPSLAVAAEAKVAASVAREARALAMSQNATLTRFAELARDTVIGGMRNRIFLKYIGVDFEFWNTGDMVYRGGSVAQIEGVA